MVLEVFYQTELERFEGDISDFVFDIPEISPTNEYRLTVARDRAFKSIVFQIDGVKSGTSVTFTPTEANVSESSILFYNRTTYFMVQEIAAGEPVQSPGYGIIKWRFAPD